MQLESRSRGARATTRSYDTSEQPSGGERHRLVERRKLRGGPRGCILAFEAKTGDDSVAIPRKGLGRADDAPDRRGVPQQAHDAITQALVVMAESRDPAAEARQVRGVLDVHDARRTGRSMDIGGSPKSSSLWRVAIQDFCGCDLDMGSLDRKRLQVFLAEKRISVELQNGRRPLAFSRSIFRSEQRKYVAASSRDR